MEMIIISKKRFNLAFQDCLDKLNLDNLQDQKHYNLDNQNVISLHRKFHYEITGLKEQLEKG